MPLKGIAKNRIFCRLVKYRRVLLEVWLCVPGTRRTSKHCTSFTQPSLSRQCGTSSGHSSGWVCFMYFMCCLCVTNKWMDGWMDGYGWMELAIVDLKIHSEWFFVEHVSQLIRVRWLAAIAYNVCTLFHFVEKFSSVQCQYCPKSEDHSNCYYLFIYYINCTWSTLVSAYKKNNQQEHIKSMP